MEGPGKPCRKRKLRLLGMKGVDHRILFTMKVNLNSEQRFIGIKNQNTLVYHDVLLFPEQFLI